MALSLLSQFPKERSVVHEELIRSATHELATIIQNEPSDIPQSFLRMVDDEETKKKIHDITERMTMGVLPKTVFVVGIGGANLGTKAIYDALYSQMSTGSFSARRMVFLDTIGDAITNETLHQIDDLKRKEEFIVVVVSKSGKTLETIANAEFLISRLEAKFDTITKRIIVVGAEESPLIQDAKEKSIETIVMPSALSDRFSAFSVTTLVPLITFGVPVDEYLQGGKIERDNIIRNPDVVEKTTQSIVSAQKKGLSIIDLFYFDARLETLGKWHRQLFAESLGKEKTDGTRLGLTPMVSIGTTDLHSILQLRLAGPRNTITRFVTINEYSKEIVGDTDDILSISGLSEQRLGDISSAIFQSVIETYTAEKLAYTHVSLESVSMKSIGSYMMYSMIETVLLASVFGVNPFDQPKVESYKEIARKLLQT